MASSAEQCLDIKINHLKINRLNTKMNHNKILAEGMYPADLKRNIHDQPIGESLPGWTRRSLPEHGVLLGRYCRLEPVSFRHVPSLFAAYHQAEDDRDWTYLPLERPETLPDFHRYLEAMQAFSDPQHYAIVDQKSDEALGTVALMRISPDAGSIEVGYVIYSPRLKHTVMATEAQFLLMQYAFDALQYRRYEWKCDSLNDPSRAAALRLGFSFEGIFRQALVYKGRNRDTAWFSIIDSEWPKLKAGYQRWLAADNFDDKGRQINRLQSFIQAA